MKRARSAKAKIGALQGNTYNHCLPNFRALPRQSWRTRRDLLFGGLLKISPDLIRPEQQTEERGSVGGAGCSPILFREVKDYVEDGDPRRRRPGRICRLKGQGVALPLLVHAVPIRVRHHASSGNISLRCRLTPWTTSSKSSQECGPRPGGNAADIETGPRSPPAFSTQANDVHAESRRPEGGRVSAHAPADVRPFRSIRRDRP
jgi:hypothetical protein